MTDMTNGTHDNDPQRPDDEAFERYLEGGSAVSRAYAEARTELPPPELDARILIEAQREARRRRWLPQSLTQRWMRPLALAATVVLAFSLVLTLLVEERLRVVGERAAPVADMQSVGPVSSAPVRARPEAAPPAPQAPAALATAPPTPQGAAELEDSAARNEVISAERAEQLAAMRRQFEDGSPEMHLRESRYAEQRLQLIPPGATLRGAELDAAVETLRAYLAEPETPAAPAKAEADRAEAADDGARRSVERAVSVYDAGEREHAALLLAEFRQRYPDHPVIARIDAAVARLEPAAPE